MISSSVLISTKQTQDAVWGAVTTAMLADATPAALTAHTRDRNHYASIIDQGLNGLSNFSWTEMKGPEVYFGGGAEQFFPNDDSYEGKDYYAEFAKKGYTVSNNKTALEAADPEERALGVFCQGHMPVWLDRNVYKENLECHVLQPRQVRRRTIAAKRVVLQVLKVLLVDVAVQPNGHVALTENAQRPLLRIRRLKCLLVVADGIPLLCELGIVVLALVRVVVGEELLGATAEVDLGPLHLRPGEVAEAVQTLVDDGGVVVAVARVGC